MKIIAYLSILAIAIGFATGKIQFTPEPRPPVIQFVKVGPTPSPVPEFILKHLNQESALNKRAH